MRRRLWLAWVVVVAACGSRTGLLVLEEQAVDAGPEAGHDAGRDARPDHFVFDAPDVFDAPPEHPDVFHNDCTDAALTYIYLVSDQRELFSFDPGAGAFRDIGNMSCPTTDTGFSMAVDRKGTAYVLLQPGGTTPVGNLWRVSIATAACTAIPQYVPNQQGFGVFGMGFATNGGGPSERLYVIGTTDFGSTAGFASIDTTTFQLTFIGANNPPLSGAELTGTGDGRLFSFYFYSTNGPTFLGELDKTTGMVIQETQLMGVSGAGAAFATAFWGGDFYFFIAPGGVSPTTVTRYRPSDGSYADAGTLGAVIVGAGVSTCAPQQ